MNRVTTRSEEGLRVLILAPSRRPFLDQQISALEGEGVDTTVVTVPGTAGERNSVEYMTFLSRSVATSLDAFDLIHAHYGLTAPFALAARTRPMVLTLWGSDVQGPPWLHRLSLAGARRAAAVIVPFTSMQNSISTDTAVIPFGVDLDRFVPIDRSTARERVGWSDHQRSVLFPWDPDREVKRHDLAERIVGRVPHATLREVHDVSHQRMPLYVNASDAVLVTSDRESGPMVVREAAACNVPVVSRDVGIAADVLEDVDACAVVEGEAAMATALKRVIGHRSNGRAAVTGLDPTRSATQLRDLYISVA